ncbi:MAG: acyltransferase [Hyphomicrobiales bacterium]
MTLHINRSTLKLPEGINIFHRLDCVDRNYAQLTPNIGMQYVFEQKIDVDFLKKSLLELVKNIPALAGRADFKAMKVSGKDNGIPFVVVDGYPGSANDHGQIGSVQRNRKEFVIEPTSKKIIKGKAALMYVKLTNFLRGGCILGITISHVLMDAAAFHMLVHLWSTIFISLKEDKYSPKLWNKKINFDRSLFQFGTNRDKETLLEDIGRAGLPKPINFNGIFGKLTQYVSLKFLERIRRSDREIVYFSKERKERLKQVVTEESGEPWITTYEALCAHFSKIISELGGKETGKMQLLTVRDLRGRIDSENKEKHALFLGNALFVYNIRTNFGKAYKTVGRGEIAACMRRASSRVTPELLKADMDFVYDCLRSGYGYPGFDLRLPFISLNSQLNLDVYGVNFGAGKLLRVIPQEVGDGLLFFPDGNGGVEIYLRDVMHPKRQKTLLTPEWQARIFSI